MRTNIWLSSYNRKSLKKVFDPCQPLFIPSKLPDSIDKHDKSDSSLKQSKIGDYFSRQRDAIAPPDPSPSPSASSEDQKDEKEEKEPPTVPRSKNEPFKSPEYRGDEKAFANHRISRAMTNLRIDKMQKSRHCTLILSDKTSPKDKSEETLAFVQFYKKWARTHKIHYYDPESVVDLILEKIKGPAQRALTYIQFNDIERYTQITRNLSNLSRHLFDTYVKPFTLTKLRQSVLSNAPTANEVINKWDEYQIRWDSEVHDLNELVDQMLPENDPQTNQLLRINIRISDRQKFLAEWGAIRNILIKERDGQKTSIQRLMRALGNPEYDPPDNEASMREAMTIIGKRRAKDRERSIEHSLQLKDMRNSRPHVVNHITSNILNNHLHGRRQSRREKSRQQGRQARTSRPVHRKPHGKNHDKHRKKHQNGRFPTKHRKQSRFATTAKVYRKQFPKKYQKHLYNNKYNHALGKPQKARKYNRSGSNKDPRRTRTKPYANKTSNGSHTYKGKPKNNQYSKNFRTYKKPRRPQVNAITKHNRNKQVPKSKATKNRSQHQHSRKNHSSRQNTVKTKKRSAMVSALGLSDEIEFESNSADSVLDYFSPVKAKPIAEAQINMIQASKLSKDELRQLTADNKIKIKQEPASSPPVSESELDDFTSPVPASPLKSPPADPKIPEIDVHRKIDDEKEDERSDSEIPFPPLHHRVDRNIVLHHLLK